MREMSQAELEAFVVCVMEASSAAVEEAFEAQREVNRAALGNALSLSSPSRAELADAIGAGVGAGVVKALEELGLLKGRT